MGVIDGSVPQSFTNMGDVTDTDDVFDTLVLLFDTCVSYHTGEGDVPVSDVQYSM